MTVQILFEMICPRAIIDCHHLVVKRLVEAVIGNDHLQLS